LRLSEREFWRSTPRKIIEMWQEYRRIHGGDTEQGECPEENVVIRDGKPYRKVKPQNAAWCAKMF
jgi:hypothetical protein